MIYPQQLTTLSVALCTYNGGAYLAKQWESLLAQERLPDELVVCDDGSTDGTFPLLNQLAANCPFPVRVIKNPVRLGFDKNFEQALSYCSGDLIFICDQDDFWLPQKLRVMTDYMDTHPAIQIAFNNAWIANEQLHREGSLFWDRLRFTNQAQELWTSGRAMDVLLDSPRVMGCGTVLRRALVAQLLPIPSTIPTYNYDGWISLVGAALDIIQFVDEPLQLYRLHANQSIGLKIPPPSARIRLRDRLTRDPLIKRGPLSRKKVELLEIQQLLTERIGVETPGIGQLRSQLGYYAMRADLPDNRLKRLGPIWRELNRGSYHRYRDASTNWYRPYLTAFSDWLE